MPRAVCKWLIGKEKPRFGRCARGLWGLSDCRQGVQALGLQGQAAIALTKAYAVMLAVPAP